MADDSLDNLLDLEQDFYKEGYDAGLADGQDAGLIEGKIFGIEKGYEKALEMGRLHGRGMVWDERLPLKEKQGGEELHVRGEVSTGHAPPTLEAVARRLQPLSENARLRKHIEAFLSLTNGTTIATHNSDEAVADFEERITRATAKAKVISQIVGEQFVPSKTGQTPEQGIEESIGISARH